MADEDEDPRERVAKRRAGQETKRASDTIKVVMDTYEGRWWMAEILSRSNMYSTLYKFDGDSLGMAWRDGQADMGRFLLGQIDEFAPGQYQRLIREMVARRERALDEAKEAERLKAEEENPEYQEIVGERSLETQAAFFEAAKLDRAKETEK